MGDRNRNLVGDIDPILSKFAAGYKNPRMIGDIVAPKIETLTESGTYFSLDKAGFKVYNTKRAVRARPGAVDFYPSSSTFTCKEHSLEAQLDLKKEIAVAEKYGANKVLKLKQRSLMVIENALAVAREKAIADILFSGTYYASGNKTTLSGTDCWDDQANSDIVGQISDGIVAARADMGVEPNTLVLGYESWTAMKQHPQMLGKIKNSKNQFLSVKDAQEILDIKEIVIGKSIYSDDDGTFTNLWTDNAALIYLPQPGELAEGVPAHTIQLHEIGYPSVETLIDSVGGNWLGREFHKYAIENISTSNGYLIVNTNA